MKKLIRIICCLCLFGVFISCNNQNKIWLISIGETKKNVKKILEKNDIDYVDEDSVFNITAPQHYLDIDWNETNIFFEDNVTTAIDFKKLEGDALSKDQKKTVVYHFDKIYGEHKNDKSSEIGFSGWSWDNGEVVASFMSILKGHYAMLLVCKKKEKNSDYR